MEDNKLIFNEDGKEIDYRVLLDIEDVNGKNYIVYTKDELNDKGDIITYAASYIKNENGGVKLSSIKDDKEWEFIRDIVNSIDKEEE